MNDKRSYKNIYLLTDTIARKATLFLCCLLSLNGFSQTGEETVNTLVKMGFENVGWSEDTKERVYVMENAAYRLNGIGVGKAVDVVQRMGLPDRKPCRLIFLDNNVPQISLYYQPIIADSLSEAKRADWNVSYDLGDNWRSQTKGKKQNSSLYKVDVVVYPELSLKNLVITQVYQVLFNLSPTIEVSFWKGMKLTAQMVIPIYNDGFEMMSDAVYNIYDKVHPGIISLSQTVRLPYNTWATFSVGHFSSNRYGLDLKLRHTLKIDERFSLEGRVGYTGACYWDAFTCHFSTKKVATWSLGGSFYWPKYNVETAIKAEQYIQGEKGVRVDMIRHFRYASIGFYAMKADGIKANGGFRFQIALPPYRYKRKGYIPRVTPSKNIGMAYNAGNERNYYKAYRPMPNDNIMQNNSFNPYFIKSELLNF